MLQSFLTEVHTCTVQLRISHMYCNTRNTGKFIAVSIHSKTKCIVQSLHRLQLSLPQLQPSLCRLQLSLHRLQLSLHHLQWSLHRLQKLFTTPVPAVAHYTGYCSHSLHRLQRQTGYYGPHNTSYNIHYSGNIDHYNGYRGHSLHRLDR